MKRTSSREWDTSDPYYESQGRAPTHVVQRIGAEEPDGFFYTQPDDSGWMTTMAGKYDFKFNPDTLSYVAIGYYGYLNDPGTYASQVYIEIGRCSRIQ